MQHIRSTKRKQQCSSDIWRPPTQVGTPQNIEFLQTLKHRAAVQQPHPTHRLQTKKGACAGWGNWKHLCDQNGLVLAQRSLRMEALLLPLLVTWKPSTVLRTHISSCLRLVRLRSLKKLLERFSLLEKVFRKKPPGKNFSRKEKLEECCWKETTFETTREDLFFVHWRNTLGIKVKLHL